MTNKTYSQKPVEVTRKWILVDASEGNLGRVATTVAKYLIGKYKPSYTAHIDGGDFVVVVNAGKVNVTGTKLTSKMYYRHSGFPGGIKERTLKDQLNIDPTKVIVDAVTGMLPKNKLVDGRLKRLKVFAGEDHSHTAQTPTKVEVER